MQTLPDVLVVDSLSSSNPPAVSPDTSLVVTPSPLSNLSLTMHHSLGLCQIYLSMVVQTPINLCRSLGPLLPRMVFFSRRVSQFKIIWLSSGLFLQWFLDPSSSTLSTHVSETSPEPSTPLDSDAANGEKRYPWAPNKTYLSYYSQAFSASIIRGQK